MELFKSGLEWALECSLGYKYIVKNYYSVFFPIPFQLKYYSLQFNESMAYGKLNYNRVLIHNTSIH